MSLELRDSIVLLLAITHLLSGNGFDSDNEYKNSKRYVSLNEDCPQPADPTNYVLNCNRPAVGKEDRPMGAKISLIAIHAGIGTTQSNLNTLTTNYSDSVHYLVPVESSGPVWQIYRLVPDSRKAFHLSQRDSYWKGLKDLNNVSIGITLSQHLSPSHNYTFSTGQLAAFKYLLRDLLTMHNLTGNQIFGQSDLCSPRNITVSPGPLFPWKDFYQSGFGYWPDDKSVERIEQLIASCNYDFVADRLSKFGYGVGNRYKVTMRQVTQLFQVHFRPTNYGGSLDTETCAIIEAIYDKYQSSASLIGGRWLNIIIVAFYTRVYM